MNSSCFIEKRMSVVSHKTCYDATEQAMGQLRVSIFYSITPRAHFNGSYQKNRILFMKVIFESVWAFSLDAIALYYIILFIGTIVNIYEPLATVAATLKFMCLHIYCAKSSCRTYS